AGETAAKIDPNISESTSVKLNRSDPNITIPTISNVAGINAINNAGLPILFKSSILSDNPALSNITINAICLKSAEILSILISIKLRTNGPSKIPVIIYPIICGILNFLNISDKVKPTKIISESDNNICTSNYQKK